MSRSYRKPAFLTCCGAHPKEGKQVKSREIRRKVNQLLHIEGEEFDFCHLQDCNRGQSGSKDIGWGADYFGDGKMNPYQAANWAKVDEHNTWFESLKRK